MCLSVYNCILNIYQPNYFSSTPPTQIHFGTNGKFSDSLSFSPRELVRYMLYTCSHVNKVLCSHRIRLTLPAILIMLKFQITNQSILLIKVDKKASIFICWLSIVFFNSSSLLLFFLVLIFFIITFE